MEHVNSFELRNPYNILVWCKEKRKSHIFTNYLNLYLSMHCLTNTTFIVLKKLNELSSCPPLI